MICKQPKRPVTNLEMPEEKILAIYEISISGQNYYFKQETRSSRGSQYPSKSWQKL
jgi:hypothetical protein